MLLITRLILNPARHMPEFVGRHNFFRPPRFWYSIMCVGIGEHPIVGRGKTLLEEDE
jgi:hypothetical protein